MKKISKKALALLLCVLAVAAFFSTAAFAAESLDVTKNASLQLHADYEGQPVKGAAFRLYHLADMDANVHFTLTPAFAGYKVNTTGLTQEQWQELASTLSGYVRRDNLAAIESGTTDASGKLVFTGSFKPGLYLLIGDNVTAGGYVYTMTPSILVLPENVSLEQGLWEYNCNVEPKVNRRSTGGGGGGGNSTLTRRVLKVWDDKGMESQRPEEITVQLLRGETVTSTVKLNAANNWRYEWTDLSPVYTWTIVEKDVPVGYTVKGEQQGVTYTITNTAQPCEIDPPIKKVISGDKPETDATFRFVMEAVSNTAGFAVKDMPMPPGAVDGKIIKDVKGGGEYEFGFMKYLRPGTYVYRIYEDDTGAAGYTYDKNEYTMTCVVTENNGKLSVTASKTVNQREVSDMVFTNQYKATTTPPKDPPAPSKPSQLPQTGMLWWPVPILGLLGIFMLAVGLIRRRGSQNEG